jgi:hypothetical protein
MAQDYGLKISKPGYDVNTAAVKDQIFNSSYSNFKIIAQGSLSISVGGTVGTEYTNNVAHGLSVVPGHMEFFQHRNTSNSYPSGANAGDGLDGLGYAKTDGTNYTAVVISNGTSYTATVYYYIFADPAT